MYQRIKELRIMNTLLNQLMKKLYKHLSQVEETSNYIHDLNKSRLFEKAKKAYYNFFYRNVIIHGIIIVYLRIFLLQSIAMKQDFHKIRVASLCQYYAKHLMMS